MKLQIQGGGKNLKTLMREIGYFENVNRKGELNYIRQIGGADYPRFHIYPKNMGEGFELDIHFDAKRPSYGGARAHNGEYDGDLIEKEGERIRRALGI
ncbi:MAG: hypothetical protein V1698_02475 [bacterium]